MAAGEAIVTAMRQAVERKTPFIFFISSGGARMQEGVLSLMQMPRTTVAVQELRAAKLPYVVVLTHPTTGGVTPPTPCWATCMCPSQGRSSASPASA